MLWSELSEEEKRKRMLKVVEKAKEMEVCDIFQLFREMNPDITITLKQFYDYFLYLEEKGEIEV